MILSLIHDDGITEFFEINEFPIFVGRSPECQVCIESENISRKHLEIQKKDDQFYIRDMTLSNWVSYNEKRLEKTEFVEYFVFSELLLPGGYQIKLSPSDIEEPNIGQTQPEKRAQIDLYNTPLRRIESKEKSFKQKKNVSREKLKKNDFIYILITAFFLVGGYLYFQNQYFTSEDQSSKKVRVLDKRVVTLKKRKKIIRTEFLNKMLPKFNKCGQVSVTKICEDLIPKRFGREGVIEFQNNLFIFKHLTRRVSLYKDEIKDIEKRIDLSSEIALKVVAIKDTLSPANLSQLLDKEIEYLFISLYDENNQSSGIIKSYKIRVENLKTVSAQVYAKAFEDLHIGVGTDVFETYIFAIMQTLEES